MTDPDIAVVIPIYNRPDLLREAIASALAQDPRPVEVIVVDDGSDEPLDDVVAAFPGVRLVRQDNGGPGAARDTGLKLATTSFVAFLDSDDRLLPGALATGLASVLAHPEAAYTSGASRLITRDGVPMGGELPQPRRGDLYARLLRRVYICPPAVVLFRRDALLAAGGWSPDPALRGVEDWECYLRVARTAPIACHGSTVAEYRMHDGQLSGDGSRMLAATIALLTAEAAHTAGRRGREGARRAGLRYWRVRGTYTTARAARARARAAGDHRAQRRSRLRAACWYAPSFAYWLPESRPARWAAARVLRRDLRP